MMVEAIRGVTLGVTEVRICLQNCPNLKGIRNPKSLPCGQEKKQLIPKTSQAVLLSFLAQHVRRTEPS